MDITNKRRPHFTNPATDLKEAATNPATDLKAAPRASTEEGAAARRGSAHIKDK
jgi:hypothetical protein